MKTLFALIFTFLLIPGRGFTQVETKQPKFIDVTGSAEMEITPDELYFKIILEEYNPEKGEKIAIEKLEKDLQKAVADAGIAKENLTIENVYGQNWVKKKKQKDFLQKKSYLLKLSDASKIDAILDKLDQKAVENVYIEKYWHSKMEEFRKQLKIEAIKSSKEKAKYLLDAIGEQLGGALHIYENTYGFGGGAGAGFAMDENQSSNLRYQSYDDKGGYESDIEIKKIKLRFEIRVEYEIK